MYVQLLPAALDDIAVLRACGFRGAGLLLGSEIGRMVLIERLLPLDFDRRRANAVYGAAHEKYKEKLRGVFFCRKPPFAADGFIGDLALAIRAMAIQPFTCEFAAAKKKAQLIPLPEDAEAAWPS